jgi:nucleotide-binding universal stress UspA family protein
MSHATVVTGYEGRPQSRDALALARLLGRAWDASVLAVWVPDRDEPYSTATHEATRDRIQVAHQLRAEAGEVLDGGPDWELTTQPALWPADGLSRVAREQTARAIVVGSSHLGAIGRVVIGSTAARLLTAAPCPVAVAPRGWAHVRPLEASTIGVALDGCRDCEAALERATALSVSLDAHLVPLSVSDGGAAHVAEALADASHDLDLLVVGCRRCAGVLWRPLRSVSRRLVQTTACPLLVVPASAPAGR